jgi:Ca2+-binding RTX toxin-like protein
MPIEINELGIQVTPFSDDRFIVTYHNELFGLDLYGQVFSADGVKSGPQFSFAGVPGEVLRADYSIVALRDGKFMAYWVDISDIDRTNFEVSGQLFNVNGTAAGSEFLLNSTTVGNQTELETAYLPNGTVVVIYKSDEVVPGQNVFQTDIRARLLSESGIALGPDFIVNTTTQGLQGAPTITALKGGGFVISWLSDEGPNHQIRARVYNSSGVASGADFAVSNLTNDDQVNVSSSIGALANGGFVVTWHSKDAGGSANLVARTFNSSGVPTSGEFELLDSAPGVYSVAVLADGRLFLAWNEGVGPGVTVYSARVYTDNGVAIGEKFALATSFSDFKTGLDLASLSDGRVAASWSQVDLNDGPYSKSGVWNPLIYNGTAGSDFWIGGTLKDTISGLGGIDDLSGGAGDDVIDGGLDNDILKGDAGNDRLRGGAGNDNMNGGTGIDTAQFDGPANGGWDINLVTGRAVTTGLVAETDTLVGIEGVIGSAGNDFIQARDGAIFINSVVPVSPVYPMIDGGKGIDTLTLSPKITSNLPVGATANDIVTLSSSVAGIGSGTVKTATQILTGSGFSQTLVAATGTLQFKNIENLNTGDGNDVINNASGTIGSPTVAPLNILTIDGGVGTDTLALAANVVNPALPAGSGPANDVVVFSGLGAGSVTTATQILTGSGLTQTLQPAARYLKFKNIETLNTGIGNDKVTGSAVKDTVFLGDGVDIANMGDGDDSVFGEGGIDTINGGNGIDSIMGGLGADKLTGGVGADTFFYVNTADGTDIISDFAADDFLAFKGTVFGNLAKGALAAANFWTNTTGVAHDADDRFIFNTTDDTLWYDADGNAVGAAFKMADMNIAFDLTAADIVIV